MSKAVQKLNVTQIRSPIGHPEKIRRILKGLGLRRMHQTVVVPNTPAFRGMIKKIIHMLKVEEYHG